MNDHKSDHKPAWFSSLISHPVMNFLRSLFTGFKRVDVDEVPVIIPMPLNSDKLTTACDYCVVMCDQYDARVEASQLIYEVATSMVDSANLMIKTTSHIHHPLDRFIGPSQEGVNAAHLEFKSPGDKRVITLLHAFFRKAIRHYTLVTSLTWSKMTTAQKRAALISRDKMATMDAEVRIRLEVIKADADTSHHTTTCSSLCDFVTLVAQNVKRF